MSWHIYAVGGKEAALRLARDARLVTRAEGGSGDASELDAFRLAQKMLVGVGLELCKRG